MTRAAKQIKWQKDRHKRHAIRRARERYGWMDAGHYLSICRMIRTHDPRALPMGPHQRNPEMTYWLVQTKGVDCLVLWDSSVSAIATFLPPKKWQLTKGVSDGWPDPEEND